jgi:hypothetical protein
MKYVMAIALLVAGCGKDLSKFTGTWKTSSTTTCGNNTSMGMSNNTQIKVGTVSDLVIIDECGCNLQWTATSGNTATLVVPQSCNGSCGNLTFTANYTGGTLTTDGMTGSYSFTGSGTFTVLGVGGTCSFTQNGTATKISQ